MNPCLPLLCVTHASTLILNILFSISIPFHWLKKKKKGAGHLMTPQWL